MASINSSTTGSNLIAQIDNIATQAGWTKATNAGNFPYTYTNPVATRDRLVQFQIAAQTASYFQFTAVGPLGSKTFYLWCGGQSLAGSYPYFLAAGPNHFLIVIEGPSYSAGAGVTEDVTYGSSRGFFGMFAIEPYFQTDTVKDNLVLAMSSNSSASKVSENRAFVAKSRSNVSWQEARLLTVKPMIQGVAAAGVQMKKDAANSLQVSYPIIVNENADGIRGRVKDLYYGGESYTDTGDIIGTQWAEQTYSNVDGNNHQVIYPFYLPNVVTQYSPLGVPVKTTTGNSDSVNGGPAVLVRI